MLIVKMLNESMYYNLHILDLVIPVKHYGHCCKYHHNVSTIPQYSTMPL